MAGERDDSFTSKQPASAVDGVTTMTTPALKRRQVPSLTGLRAVAAAAVFIVHAGFDLTDIARSASSGPSARGRLQASFFFLRSADYLWPTCPVGGLVSAASRATGSQESSPSTWRLLRRAPSCSPSRLTGTEPRMRDCTRRIWWRISSCSNHGATVGRCGHRYSGLVAERRGAVLRHPSLHYQRLPAALPPRASALPRRDPSRGRRRRCCADTGLVNAEPAVGLPPRVLPGRIFLGRPTVGTRPAPCAAVVVASLILHGWHDAGHGVNGPGVLWTAVPCAVLASQLASHGGWALESRWIVRLGIWSYGFFLVHTLVITVTSAVVSTPPSRPRRCGPVRDRLRDMWIISAAAYRSWSNGQRRRCSIGGVFTRRQFSRTPSGGGPSYGGADAPSTETSRRRHLPDCAGPVHHRHHPGGGDAIEEPSCE